MERFKTFFLLLVAGYLLPGAILLGQKREEPPPELDPIEAEVSLENLGLNGYSEDWISRGSPLEGTGRVRSWSALPRVLLEDFGIDGIEDLAGFAPGLTANAQFGHPALPTIRGDVGELYINGQRRSNNQYGFKPGFNSVEAAVVLRGPAPVGRGPGFHSGGFLELETKRPDLKMNRTRLGFEVGGLSSGGTPNWFAGEVKVDVSRVLEPGLAGVRLSYTGRGNETQLGSPAAADDSHALYGSFLRAAENGWRLWMMGEWLWQNAPQLLGVNRPSPELFEAGRYFRGEATDVGGAFVIVPPAEGTEAVLLDETKSLLSVGDRSRAEVGWLQSIAEKEGAVTFRNRTFFERVDRERVHEFEYFEYVDQATFENRSEWEGTLASKNWEVAIRGGVVLRWEARESYVNFFNEIPFAYDLSRDAVRFSIRDRYPGRVVPGIPGPDGLEFFGQPFSPETTHSTLWNPAGFLEGTIFFGETWELDLGVRLDGLHAEAEDPLVPAPRDTESLGVWSGSLSTTWKSRKGEALALTLADTNGVEGSIAGGGIMLNAAGEVNRANLENRSRLLEIAWKKSFEQRAEIGISAYQQERRRLEIRGNRSDIRVRGLEVEGRWLVEGYGAFFATLTHTDGEYRNSAPSQLGGRSLYDLYAAGTGPGGAGTGNGFDFFFLNQVPPGDYPIPGISDWTGNFGWVLEADGAGLPGFRVWGRYRSPQVGNLDGEYEIPEAWELNAGVDFAGAGWSLSLDWLNLTDAVLWQHNGQTFFNNQLVARGLPGRLELRVERKW